MRLEIKSEELKQYKLFFATPMYGGQCFGTYSKSVADLSALATHYAFPLQLYFLFNESLITRARNYACDEFLRSDCTHMVFVDSDIGFSAQDIVAMFVLQIQNPQYDILGAPYPKKCISWEKIKVAVDKGFADENPENLAKYVGDFVINFKPGTEKISLVEPCEVLELGTGFMMFRKETLLKFKEAYPEYTYRPDHVRTAAFDGSREIHQFFQAEIDKLDEGRYYKDVLQNVLNLNTHEEIQQYVVDEFAKVEIEKPKYSKRYLSEDYWFCQKAQKAGLTTWLCPWMQLQHTGTMVFGGSLMDLANAGLTATVDTSQLKKSK